MSEILFLSGECVDGGIGGVTGNLMVFNCSYPTHAVFIGIYIEKYDLF